MGSERFELLGHGNPLGRYPAPVVPVGHIDNRLVAVYAGNKSPEVIDIDEKATFIKHDSILRKDLSSFDFHLHRLFALSEKEVEYYLIADEKNYFHKLLRDMSFSSDNVFLRLSLAKATKDVSTIGKEMFLCAQYLSSESPHFVEAWYVKEREALLKLLGDKSQTDLPAEWRHLKPSTRQQPLNLTGTASRKSTDSTSDERATHQYAENRDGSFTRVATGTATAAGRSRMVTGIFRDRESAERAFGSLSSRGYDKDDISLLMLDETREKHFAEVYGSELGNRAWEEAGKGAAIGGGIGATLAAIAAIGTTLALPGLGLLIAGPLAAGIAGAGAGGLTGGLIGALIGSGIPEERAKAYEAGIKSGGIVMGVIARSDEDAEYFESDWKKNRGEQVYR